MAGVFRVIQLLAPATSHWEGPNHGGGLAPPRPPLDPPLGMALRGLDDDRGLGALYGAVLASMVGLVRTFASV
jgi:hypothetical protein